jgi:hypothetical protein
MKPFFPLVSRVTKYQMIDWKALIRNHELDLKDYPQATNIEKRCQLMQRYPTHQVLRHMYNIQSPDAE